jgi:hypothetical protein
MLSILKDTLSYLSKTWSNVKSYLFGLKKVSLSEENKEIPAPLKEDYSRFLSTSSNRVDYVIFLVDKLLTYNLYLTHVDYLKDRLRLSRKFGRINVELVCKTRDTDKAVIFNLPRTHTLYEDTYISEMDLIYKEILLVSDRYNVKSVLSINMIIHLYSKTYKIKTLEK